MKEEMRRKYARLLALLLAIAMLFTGSALAAEGVADNGKATVTAQSITNGTATATFEAEGSDIINVTFTSEALTEGGQYLVLMVKGTEDSYTITEDAILYIDQTAAENKTISFKINPSSLRDSVILITGAGVNGTDPGPLVAAIVKGQFILGDVNGDGKINSSDAILILQHSVGIETLEGSQFLAGDVSADNRLNSTDAILILQFSVGLIQGF